MLILSYTDQLKMLAAEQKVDLLDAVRHAGLNPTIFYRSIVGKMQLRQDKAEAIAAAIKQLGVN